jgi:hypothetical protein
MGQKVHPIGFRSGNYLKTPQYSAITWEGLNSRSFPDSEYETTGKKVVQEKIIFTEISSILDSFGFILNRVDLTSPGKNTILVCEVLTKTSYLEKSSFARSEIKSKLLSSNNLDIV